MNQRRAQLRRHVKRVLARRNRYQFGQPRDTLVAGGAVACTDTCIQLVALMATGKRVSLDRVRLLSGGPTDGSRGLRPSEALRALTRLGLAYELRTDITLDSMLRIVAAKGPVILAENYWAHPQQRGAYYLGKSADGRARNGHGRVVRVGFAHPGGKTQLVGFDGGHAVLVAWTPEDRSMAGVRDPNHNSVARPERPAWDGLTRPQLLRMLNSIKGDYGGRRLAYVPTRRVI